MKWNTKASVNKNLKKDFMRKALNKLSEDLATLYQQLDSLHDLLERGVYDTEKFTERNTLLAKRIEEKKKESTNLEAQLKREEMHENNQKTIIPKIEYLLDVYNQLPNAQAKNELLKEVVEKVVYLKEKKGRWHYSPDDFEITIYPKLPSH